MRKVVVKDHVASYPDPIAVKAGDTVYLSGKADNWDGHEWLWAIGPDRREGWVPGGIVGGRDGNGTYAIRDYSAAELTCRKGEVLLIVEETHGWAWCRSAGGKQGWVPLCKLVSPEEAGLPATL
ncbi:hypothetical protein C7U60_01595 [Mesorhizobium plurifarium]|nr:hypothetical protein C7U60_01595 [Mesorhizobium plurifarium]